MPVPQTKSIWKFEVHGEMVEVIEMPLGAKPLTVALQTHSSIARGQMWAEVDPKAEKARYNIHMVGTGWEKHLDGLEYISTVLDGSFVWHFYFDPKPVTHGTE